MSAIFILSDTLTPDNPSVKKLHGLFPDCEILILKEQTMDQNKKVIQSALEFISSGLNRAGSEN